MLHPFGGDGEFLVRHVWPAEQRKDKVTAVAVRDDAKRHVQRRSVRVAQSDGGSPVYKYSDSDYCNCLWVGGPNEYAELQRLRAERVREHEQMLRTWSPWTPADPRVWGPWKPEGLELK